jgi:hypothetical protein
MEKEVANGFDPESVSFVMETTKKRYVANTLTEVVQMVCADWKEGEASKIRSVTQIGDYVHREVIDEREGIL